MNSDHNPAAFAQDRTRFAPSPTGYLHFGHIVSCTYVFEGAQQQGAEVLLRIEDHDRERCRPEYEQAILEDLNWLGFKFANVITPGISSLYRQSDNDQRYQVVLDRLIKRELTYHCRCSRKDILKRTGDQASIELRYDGHCRNKAHPEEMGKTCIRLVTEDNNLEFQDEYLGRQIQNPYQQCGDISLRNRKGHWTYQFTNTIDDIEDQINLIIRGVDILPSTGRQIYLRKLLGVHTTIKYAHHPLVTDQSGKKLSKRFYSESIRDLRDSGVSAADLLVDARKFIHQ